MHIRTNADLAALDPARRSAARHLLDLDARDRALLVLPPVSRAAGSYAAAWAVLLADRVFEHVRLIVPGEGPEVDRIARLVDSVDRRGMLHLPGERVSPADLVLACDAALFLPPGSAPVDALEWAMAAARPIVASAVRGVTDVLTDGVNAWLCPPGSPKDAARRLIEILDGGPDVQKRCEAARRELLSQHAAQKPVPQPA